jgi:hypothetical protein
VFETPTNPDRPPLPADAPFPTPDCCSGESWRLAGWRPSEPRFRPHHDPAPSLHGPGTPDEWADR